MKDPQAALAHYLKNAAQLSPGFQDDVGNKLFLKAKSLLAMEVNANGGVGFAPAQGGAAGAAGASTGFIYDGLLETEVSDVQRGELPYCPVKIMMNVGNPQLG